MLTCTDCATPYRPIAGHCRGGPYEGCCRSFAADRDFDLHRTLIADAAGYERRCLSDEELLAAGWVKTGHFWASPATQASAEQMRRRKADGKGPRRGRPST